MGQKGSSMLGDFGKDWEQVGLACPGKPTRFRKDGRVVDVYQVELEQKVAEESTHLYRKRIRDYCNVVRLFDLIYEGQNMCGKTRSLGVVVEGLQSRLSDHEEVGTGECLLVLEQALFGCKQLRDSTGKYFLVRTDMIHLNTQRQIRLWYHPNILQHSPLNQPAGPAQFQESQQIQSLYDAVESITVGMRFPQPFKTRWEKMARPLKYLSALEAIRQFAASQNQLVEVKKYDIQQLRKPTASLKTSPTPVRPLIDYKKQQTDRHNPNSVQQPRLNYRVLPVVPGPNRIMGWDSPGLK